jgi:hypothetical protein
MRTDVQRESEQSQLTSWRSEQLVRSGFQPDLADRLAGDPLYDLHALIELVEAGCPPPLAARILAPMAEEPN